MQMTQTDGRATLAEARASIYRLLSHALVYPDATVVGALLDDDLPLAEAASDLLGEDVATPLLAIGHRMAHRDPEEIARQYERVFTHGVSVDWPPYETAYTSKGIFQQANDLADIAGFYAAYGVRLSEEAHERPDHIGVELEFMHLLTFKEAYALQHHGEARADECRADQRRFFEEHLGRWGTEFAVRLARGNSGTLYADVADLCAALLAAEKRALEVDPTPVDGTVDTGPPPSAGGVDVEDAPCGVPVADPVRIKGDADDA